MAIETTAVYVNDLNPAFPTGAESKADGDDHLRVIKETLQNTFPGVPGAAMVAGADGGVANAYTLTPSTTLKSYTARMVAIFTPTATNTAAATLNISGLGAKEIRAADGSALTVNDLVAGRTALAVYDGAQFRLATITQNFVERLVVSRTVPGVNVLANAGKFFTTDGTSGGWESVNVTPTPGAATANKGNSSTAAQVVNYLENGVASEGQTITATGNFSLSASGFPAGRIAGVLLRAVNFGAYAVTSTGITWIKADKTQTTDYATAGLNLPASGTGFIVLFTYGDGVIFGKAA